MGWGFLIFLVNKVVANYYRIINILTCIGTELIVKILVFISYFSFFSFHFVIIDLAIHYNQIYNRENNSICHTRTLRYIDGKCNIMNYQQKESATNWGDTVGKDESQIQNTNC